MTTSIPQPAPEEHHNPYRHAHSLSQEPGTRKHPGTRRNPQKPPTGSTGSRRSPGKALLSWFLILVISVGVSTALKEFLLGNHYVFSASMEPTMKVGDRFLTLRPLLHPEPPAKGDIILFSDTGDWMGNGPGGDDAMLKRVIAVAGDTIESAKGVVYLNGQPLDEPYTAGVTGWFPQQTVPEGHVWVMGDNRENSADSRSHIQQGTQFVPVDSIMGWPWLQYQPDFKTF